VITRFQPSVSSAELAAVTGPEVMILRLVIIGENIFEVCLSQCLFDFGFPFGQPGMAVVKKIPLGEKGEKIVVEQAITTTDISVSDHGSNLHLATQFGSCDYLMPRKNIRDIKLQSLSQISKHESIALVIRYEQTNKHFPVLGSQCSAGWRWPSCGVRAPPRSPW